MNWESTPAQGRDTLENLLKRIAEKEETALSELYDLTSGRCFGIAKRILRNQSLAEEATLDGYTKIWKQAAQFDPEVGCARVWIQAIARNSALDLLRKESRRARVLETEREIMGRSEESATPETSMEVSERSKAIRRVLGKLGQEYRMPIMAAFYEGMSHSQIAEALGQPLGTVKTRIRKGLQLLGRELAKLKGGAP